MAVEYKLNNGGKYVEKRTASAGFGANAFFTMPSCSSDSILIWLLRRDRAVRQHPQEAAPQRRDKDVRQRPQEHVLRHRDREDP